MNTNTVMNAIAELDLEPVKTKLMHAASGEGWSRAKVDALDLEYRRFLYLMYAFPGEETAPTVDVDTFWHYHILDTMKYARDCEATFGYFLHHYPHLGMEGEHDAGAEQRGAERMRELYEQTFGQPYIRAEAYGADGAQAAFCMCRPGAPAPACSAAAFCMCRPGQQQAPVRPAQAGAQAAFCMCRPGRQASAGNDAAFCLRQAPAGAGMAPAFLMRETGQASLDGRQGACCMRHAGEAKPPGAAGAFCMRQDAPVRPAQPGTGAQAAFCMRQQGRTGAAANDAAFCPRGGSAESALAHAA